TSYAYQGGLYDPLDRRFLGFRYVKQTLPCVAGESACPYTETWFKQNYGSLSKPERAEHHDGAGTLLGADLYEYTENTDLPYTSLQTGQWSYAYDAGGSGAFKRTYVSRSFDEFANVREEVFYGDYDVPGDEKTIRYTYVPNPSAYLVGKPAETSTYAGTSTGG